MMGEIIARVRRAIVKFKIDIDCTPQEARAFLGLPDVESVQKALYAEIEARMRAALDRMDPERLLETWMPAVKGGRT